MTDSTIERDDWPATEALAVQALAIMQGGEFDDYWTSGLVDAVAARTAATRGAIAAAADLAGRAARLRPLLTHALPIVGTQTLLELARTYIALGDPGGAHAVLRQLRDIARQRPDIGTLTDQADDVRVRLDALEGEMLGVTSLTAAEIRLLPLLPTHLSFAEMGERLFVSRHTVKTQAVSIYRKIGVSSRSEAVARMNDLGLYAGLTPRLRALGAQGVTMAKLTSPGDEHLRTRATSRPTTRQEGP